MDLKRNHNHFSRSRFVRGNGHHRAAKFGRPKNGLNSHHYVNKAVMTSQSSETEVSTRFENLPINPTLLDNIRRRGYATLTPIQDKTIQPILNGLDIVGIANTGTGKTAAFLIPLIDKIVKNRNEKVLILAPTRELAIQIDEELRAFAQSLRISSLLIIGGMSINRQIQGLRYHPTVIIGTPGRMMDLIRQRVLSLSSYTNVVLDEVDRMVDIGFIKDIRHIVSLLPHDRQSLFFSATVSPDVNGIIQSFIRDPVTVSVKTQETALQIDQDVIRVHSKEEKLAKLVEMLRQDEFNKVLIFGRTKWGVERLAKTLLSMGFTVASIHGNKTQNQRLRALNEFKENQLQVMVATDIAARGLDISDVSHVINFDEPSTYTDYIHRIGRTGRANKLGKALTFVG